MTLSIEEALLLKAAQQESEKENAQNAAMLLGGTGGAALGTLAGNVPHQVGRGLNALSGRKGRMLRPGFRMAGGLTGAILGGALGGGVAAVMKQGNPSAQLLAKIQSQGGKMDEGDQYHLKNLLTEVYSNPSQL